ncbi:GDP-D-glucose phosphorylase 1 [Achroia grisella]|uniref:GDP-D-glucose phosphorylase 1 n=1 Tax=Achroia grisella TaxID=688607 RepID=UPI0027D26BA7|nr:GDP-D-glucose phosphorylase 1 [Achroia grisella]
MYKFSYFIDSNQKYKFIQLLKQKWDELHSETGLFRYKILNLQKKSIDDKYVIQLNPDRGTKRRMPEHIENICQPFNNNEFNFTKISPKEILFYLTDDNESSQHALLVNVSPLSHYHTLVCPSINNCLPQIVTLESLQLAVKIFYLAGDRDLRFAFNSLCGLASVNHLHYHLFLEKSNLPVESIKCTHLINDIYYFDDYPIPGFCFEIQDQNSAMKVTSEIYKLLEYFLEKSIAHNIFITRGQTVKQRSSDIDRDVLRILIWPRKSSVIAKQTNAFNIAACEISGWFTVYNSADYDSLQKEHLELELEKWKIGDFNELCNEIKHIF